ncbi:MAG: primosomal protein N' [Clostridia bacterium]|nr:primosomal protein N' [Clostridia bacterium]
MYCEVYVFDTPYHLDRPFDYEAIPDVVRGAIVRVPFGRADKTRLALVTRLKESAPAGVNIKPVHSVLKDRPVLSEEMLGLCLFLKEHTLCTLGEAVRTVLPPGALNESLNVKYTRTCTLAISREEATALLSASGRAGVRSEGQRRIVEYLMDIGSADHTLVRALPSVTSANITALRERGVIRISEEECIRNPYAHLARERDESEIVLSMAQTEAYTRIEELYLEDAPRAALLYGVTGSGKTKVIMKLMDRVIGEGHGVILMVPEIALTPQTVGIFCKRYGERVAVIHSSLSQGERLDAYRRIERGDVDLVIGTRSAAFAPLHDVGLIVIDEEHEHTYKSESDPKYHARDVAAYRAGHHNALMLLASATPSLESFYKAECGKYTLVPLRERFGGFRLPEAVIVDMREELLQHGNTTTVSNRLLDSLREVEENGRQAILFLNRRGYNSYVSCKECGEVITCPRCSVSLTRHASPSGGKLLCHLCGYTAPIPRVCPSCSSDRLDFQGFGTQKVEGELGQYLPDMSVMRMDADTTSGKLSYDKMIDDFRQGRADILLGTQMVAKGHDFPRVTLVGVLLADTSLYLSDFRASERTFSLLTQVIGRAGRASDNGVAVIQTYSPKNEVIRLACLQDYDTFYKGEIAIRRALSYPPFSDMVAMTVTGEDEREVLVAAREISESLVSKIKEKYSSLPFTVYGPFEAQVYKVSDKYRMRLVVKCRLNRQSRALFHELLCEASLRRGVSLAVDLNPLTV